MEKQKGRILYNGDQFKKALRLETNRENSPPIIVFSDKLDKVLQATIAFSIEQKGLTVYSKPFIPGDSLLVFAEATEINGAQTRAFTSIINPNIYLVRHGDRGEERKYDVSAEAEMIIIIEGFDKYDRNMQVHISELSETYKKLIVIGWIDSSDGSVSESSIDIQLRTGGALVCRLA